MVLFKKKDDLFKITTKLQLFYKKKYTYKIFIFSFKSNTCIISRPFSHYATHLNDLQF